MAPNPAQIFLYIYLNIYKFNLTYRTYSCVILPLRNILINLMFNKFNICKFNLTYGT